MKRPPVLIAVLLGGLVLVAAGACGPASKILEDGEQLPDRVSEVRISGGSGNVTVRADALVSGVDIRRSVRYGRAAPGKTTRVEQGVLHVATDCGDECSASYEIRLARGVRVTGENGSGTIDVRGVSDVDVRVGSGEIRVNDASGAVVARTGSGRIELANIAGDATVTTSSGAVDGRDIRGARIMIEVESGGITLDLAGTGDVSARTDSGSIEVRVPDGCCRVTAETGSGKQTIEVATNPGGVSEIELFTDSGDITVRPKE